MFLLNFNFNFFNTFKKSKFLFIAKEFIMKKYYMAYDDRYKKIHEQGFLWEEVGNSKVVIDTIKKYSIKKDDLILDLGSGEGRDSIFLLQNGYKVMGVDCSSEAVKTCTKIARKLNLKNHNFKVVDLVKDNLSNEMKFDFIYSIAVLHMLCEDEDRKSFYKFLLSHLKQNGKALICVMGDGENEFVSDYQNAFIEKQRFHKESNSFVNVASTSLRILSKENWIKEIEQNNFLIKEYFVVTDTPGFSEMMCVVLENKK